MSVISDYKARLGRNGEVNGLKDLRLLALKEGYLDSLKNDPGSVIFKRIDIEKMDLNTNDNINCIMMDISNNDQKSFDEKYILTKIEDNIRFGQYLYMDNEFWIINFKEKLSHKAYEKYVIKKCNKIIKLTIADKIYEIPVVAKNLTQYSDGMQDIKYTSMSDNRISLMFGIGSITRQIELGTRLIVGRSVYRTTFIEDYQFSNNYTSNEGLGNLIMIFDPKGEDDDIQNGIVGQPTNGIESIFGSDKLIPGGKFRYAYKNDQGVSDVKFEVEYTGKKNGYLTVIDTSNVNELIVRLDVSDDLDLIGSTVKLNVVNINTNAKIATKKLKVSVY